MENLLQSPSTAYRGQQGHARLSDTDIDDLLSHQIIQEVERTMIKAWCNVFTVVEEAKRRRRLITEPMINDLCPDTGSFSHFPLPTMEETVAFAVSQCGISCDFPWFYGQMPLDESIGVYYGFAFVDSRTNTERFFILKTVPTGGRQLPAIAQIISKSVAIETLQRSRRMHKVDFPNWQVDQVYLDNIRFAGPRDMMNVILPNLQQVCDEYEITTNIPIAVVESGYTFLGIRFDHEAQSVSLSERTLEKLAAARTPNNESTLRHILQVVGLLVHASRILLLPLAPYYHVFKFIRRRTNWPLDDLSLPWNCVQLQLAQWIHTLIVSQPRKVVKNASQVMFTLFTDASLQGWGVTLFNQCFIDVQNAAWDQAELCTACGSFRYDERIAVLEMRALEYGVRLIPPYSRVNVLVDNMAVLGAIRKKRSDNYVMNTVVQRILDHLKSTSVELMGVYWIPSANNLADCLTRLQIG